MIRKRASGTEVAWAGLGASVVALAFALHPVKASRLVFWAVLALGALGLAAGVTVMIFAQVRTRSKRDRNAESRRRVATDCRQVHDALASFLDDRRRGRPRQRRFPGNGERIDDWSDDLIARYREALRPWVRRVFADAVTCRAASKNAWCLVEATTPEQLEALPEVFRAAAEHLERADG